MSKKRKLEDEEKEAEVLELKKAHNDSMNLLKKQTEEKMKTLIEIHDSALAAEVRKFKNVEADLEEERLKRRRADRESKVHREEASRYKAQLTCSGGGGSSGANMGDIESALREIKHMEAQLDEKNQEIAQLKANGKGKVTSSGRVTRSSTLANIGTSSSSSSGPQRIKNDNNSYCSGFMEHSELSDKKIEQLNREKRELIAKNLEENKEKMEIQQKLMLSEKENATLKSKLTKLTLEKERAERKMALAKEKQQGAKSDTSVIKAECENFPLNL